MKCNDAIVDVVKRKTTKQENMKRSALNLPLTWFNDVVFGFRMSDNTIILAPEKTLQLSGLTKRGDKE